MRRIMGILSVLLVLLCAAGSALAAEECDHTYILVEEEATCTDPGMRYYECTKCGHQYGYENTDPLGHDFGDWQTQTEPGCEREGLRIRTCSRCSYQEEEKIDPTGHDYQTSVVSPTCEDQGYTRHTCSNCGDHYDTDFTDATGHSYTTEVVEPTCTKDGYTEKRCSVCGDTVKTDYVDATGHSYTEEVVEPTCTKDGYTEKRCSVCGDTVKTDYVDATGHSYTEEVVAPTCTKDGYTEKRCSVCGDTVKTDYVDATGHNYTEEVVEPTCTKEGYTKRLCTVCGNVEKTDYVPATGHSYTEEVVEPTCTKEGYTKKLCTTCGNVEKTDYVEATGHHYDDGVVIQEASTTASGKIQYTCSGCGDTYTQTTPKLVNPFVDVKKEDYFFSAVLWAVDQDVTKGVDETHFCPNHQCTRAQVVTFLWRAAGRQEPQSRENPFVDVSQGDYFYKAVLWAVEMGITNGTDGTHFSPNAGCTRAQVVTFLYRAKGEPEVKETIRFSDVKQTDYFCRAVSWAADREITTGVDSTHFGPGQICTRAQVVTFLYRDQKNG